MKLIVIVLSILTASVSFAASSKLDAPLEISDSLTISSRVVSDTMTSGIVVSYKSYDSSSVFASMSKVIDLVKSHCNICTVEGFKISPVFKTVDNTSVKDSYIGSLDFSCTFKEMKMYNVVVDEVFDTANADSGYTFTPKPIVWFISDSTYSQKSSELKYSAIKQIQQISRGYAKTLNTLCKVKDISFETFIPTTKDSGKKSRKNVQQESEYQDTNISLTADFKIFCK